MTAIAPEGFFCKMTDYAGENRAEAFITGEIIRVDGGATTRVSQGFRKRRQD